MTLSAPLLRRVGALLDQETRVAACVGSARLDEALTDPGVWRRTTVHSATPEALRHVTRVRPEVLHLTGVDARRGEWFLQELVRDAGAAAGLRALRVSFGAECTLVRSPLLHTLAEFPELRELVLEFSAVSAPSCLAFPDAAVFGRLEYVRVTEASQTRRLEVYFAGARLPELREVHLRVATCDVLAHVPRMPRLRVVRYGSARESYEDADLGCCRLDALALDVHTPTAMQFLTTALESAGRVERLQLSCLCDVRYDANAAGVRHLTILARSPGLCVGVAYWAVRRVVSLTVESAEVKFHGTGSFNNFLVWAQRTLLFVASEGEVTVDPS